MKAETEQIVAAMLNSFPSRKDTDYRLILETYKQVMEPFHDGAIQEIATRFTRGYDERRDKQFAPSLAEFTQAVDRENTKWNGMHRLTQDELSQRISGNRSGHISPPPDPDMETKRERWQRMGREMMADWDAKHGYDRAVDPVNRTPLFHKRMMELRHRYRSNIEGFVRPKAGKL